jgi:hypothetical protein
MRFTSILGWGVVIYAVMSLAWSGFIIYGLARMPIAHVAQLIILILLALIAGRALQLPDWRDILPVSLGWALMMTVLDAVYSAPFGAWHIFGNWNLWVGYGIVLVVPLLAPLTRRAPSTLDV